MIAQGCGRCGKNKAKHYYVTNFYEFERIFQTRWEKIFDNAVRSAGVTKDVSIHSFKT
jgi:hypothetical protein